MIATTLGDLLTRPIDRDRLNAALSSACPQLLQWFTNHGTEPRRPLVDTIKEWFDENPSFRGVTLGDISGGNASPAGRFAAKSAPAELDYFYDLLAEPEDAPHLPQAAMWLDVVLTRKGATLNVPTTSKPMVLTPGSWVCHLIAFIKDMGSAKAAIFHEEEFDTELPETIPYSPQDWHNEVRIADTSRIAMVAVCAPQHATTAEHNVLVLGTAEPSSGTHDGERWCYTRYTLSQFLRCTQDQNWDPFGIDDDGRWIEPESKLTDDEAAEMGYGGAHFPQPGTPDTCKRVVVRDVVQVLLYRAGFSPTSRRGATGPASAFFPACRLETCAARHSDGQLTSIVGGRPAAATQKFDVGSLVELLVQRADGAKSETVVGIRAMLDLKIALGAHSLAADGANKQGDAYDTRARIILQREATATAPNLWQPTQSNGIADACDIQWDRIVLGWTTASVYAHTESARYTETVFPREAAPRQLPKSLLELAGFDRRTQSAQGQPEKADHRGSGVDHFIPLLDQLGCQPDRGGWTEIRRQFGLRIAAIDPAAAGSGSAQMYRLVVRFETWVTAAAGPLLRSPAVEGLVGWIDNPDTTDISQQVLFSQEQRVGDVVDVLDPDAPVRWLIASRITAASFDHPDPYSPHQGDRSISERVLDRLDALAKAIHSGLRSVRDPRSVSLLPRIVPRAASGRPAALAWHFVGLLIERDAHRRNAPYFSGSPARYKHWRRDVSLFSFEPRLIPDMWRGAQQLSELEERVEALLPRLVLQSGRVPWIGIRVGAPHLVAGLAAEASPVARYPAWQPAVSVLDDPAEPTRGLRLGVRFVKLKGALEHPQVTQVLERGGRPTSTLGSDDTRVSLGALQFTLAQKFDATKQADVDGIAILTSLRPSPDPDALPSAISAVLKLPLIEVSPAGEDATSAELLTALSGSDPEDREATDNLPLLLDLDASSQTADNTRKGAGPVQFVLTLTSQEAVTRGREHNVTISLRSINTLDDRDIAQDTPPPDKQPDPLRRLLVIDPRPFRITLVEYQPVESAVTDDSNQVAIWDASSQRGSAWRVCDDKTISLILPPQVIGEAMEKNADWRDDTPRDISPGKAVEARFGSHTRMRLDPNYSAARFREPGWNLRRILGRSDQRSPGARLLDLRLELLYGLVGRIQAQDLWYCELAGVIGAPATPFADAFDNSRPYLKRYRDLVNGLLRLERSRIAVDKVWRTTPDDDPVIEAGTDFRLRIPSDPKDSEQHGPETPFRWPVPGSVPDDTGGLIDPKILARTFATAEDSPESFPGGVAWAFASANILMSVYGRPAADGARLQGIYISSLGGYGQQRVMFDRRKTIVDTETHQGRVQRYRLERIGRIAGLWNRAKHVMVFERTVTPPAQFFNVWPIGQKQDELAGRGALRKTEEYVEMLQPLRRYPEGSARPQTAGFLVAAEFKSKKIRVDSDWGRDIRREGWEVPLWDRRFASAVEHSSDPDSPANLYPKPQVRLLMMGESGDEVPVEVDEPEKLRFYTSVLSEDSDDTDSWQATRGVDFCDLPPPRAGTVQIYSDDLHDQTLPGEPAHVAGYERFTLGLVAAIQAIALTHGRQAKGPCALLRNVTVSRAAAVETTDPIAHVGDALAAPVANLRLKTDNIVGRVLDGVSKLGNLGDRVALKQAVTSLIAQAATGLLPPEVGDLTIPVLPGGPCADLKKRAAAQANALTERLRVQSTDLISNAADQARQSIEAVNKALTDVQQIQEYWHLIASSTHSGIWQAKIAELENAVGMAAREAILSAWQPQVTTATAKVDAARQAVATFGGCKQWLDSKVQDAKTAIDNQTQRVINTIKVSCLDPLQASILGAADNLATELTNAWDAIHNAWSTAKSAIAEAVAHANSADALTAAQNLLSNLDTNIEIFKRAQAKHPDDLCGKLAATALPWIYMIRTAVAAYQSAAADFQKLLVRIDNSAPGQPAGGLLGLLDQAWHIDTAAGTTVTQEINARKTALDNNVDAMMRQCKRVLGQAQASIADFVGNAASQVEATLEPLTTALADAATGISAAIDHMEESVRSLDAGVRQALGSPDKVLTREAREAAEAAANAADSLLRLLQPVLSQVDTVVNSLRDETTNAGALLQRSQQQTLDARDDLLKSGTATVDTLLNSAAGTCQNLEGWLATTLSEGQRLRASVKQKLDEYKDALLDSVAPILDDAESAIDEVKDRVQQTLAEASRQLVSGATSALQSAQTMARDVLGADPSDVAQRAVGIYQKGDGIFRALRAVGDPPKSDRMGFNRPQVAYILQQTGKLGIDMTPTLALVNRVSDQIAAVDTAGHAVADLLDSFGVRLPTTEIADQLIPAKLKDLSVRDLLPDMAGIDFRGLLRNVGFPDLDDAQAVQLKHGFDEKTLTAWLAATLDVPFSSPTPHHVIRAHPDRR